MLTRVLDCNKIISLERWQMIFIFFLCCPDLSPPETEKDHNDLDQMTNEGLV